MSINNNNNNNNENNNDLISNNESYILKRNDPPFIFSEIRHHLNLINDSEKLQKKNSIIYLHKFICIDNPPIPSDLLQEILIQFNKNFIKLSLFSPIDKIRENSLKILIHLYTNCTNVSKFFPFIFSALTDKLECNDLEGYGDLPEDIRPTPSQNPHKIIKVTEPVEEIRNLYIGLLQSLVFNENAYVDDFRLFVNDIVNITRTLCMDPAPNVVVNANNFVAGLCKKFGKDLLFYFNSILSRGCLYALSHKQAKLRLAALNAIDKLMYISPYKKNVEVMEQLIGFRDPTIVPIKDFYEPTTKFNYFAFLCSDKNISVLKKFYEIITEWLLKCEDKNEIELRITPYILTGLFNEHEEIGEYVYERFEAIGKLHEKENEKDYREQKQYGVDSPWLKFINPDELQYPFPIKKRPCLGARKIINSYIRRYIKNLSVEFEGIDENIKFKVANLLLFSIIYSEEGIIEYLDGILLMFMKYFTKNSNFENENLERFNYLLPDKNQSFNLYKNIEKKLEIACEFLGKFCDYESLTKILFSTVKGDLNGNFVDIQRGALITLKFVIIGHIESVYDGIGFLKGKIKEIFSVVDDKNFDSKFSFEIIRFYNEIFKCVRENKKKFDKNGIDEIKENLEVVFIRILYCLGNCDFINNVNLYKFIEKVLNEINNNMQEIFDDKNFNFFNNNSTKVLKNISEYLDKNFISLQNSNYKLLYLFLKNKKIFINTKTFNLSLLFEIFTKIYSKDENFNVHLNALSLLLEYLNSVEENYFTIPEYLNLLENILKNYTTIMTEEFKFKFADLLKDQKELDKKKAKNPKTLKTEIRKNLLTYLKKTFENNKFFDINNKENKNNINVFLFIFNKIEFLNIFIEEAESLRLYFIEIYYKYLIKLFVLNKDEKETLIKKITKNFEKYFLDEVYDNNIEIRKLNFNILNVILNQIKISNYYNSMKSIFNNETNLNIEAIKALNYIEEEKKNVNEFFDKFSEIIKSIINAYLNEKMSFQSLCNNAMKLIIERFPIFVFNELTKAQKKEQISRIEFFSEQLRKNFSK